MTFEDVRVSKNINLGINREEIFTIIGPNGSGKTTLLQILNLLEKPDNGTITLDGISINGTNHNGKTSTISRISMVFLTPSLFNDSVYNNIAYS